jgi:Abnormal spindle-like microcephaly-assoc'd, ASPM-SPD-2-Hydin
MKSTLLFIFLLTVAQPVLAQQATHQNKQRQQETPPAINVTPTSLDFGEQVVKRASKPKRLTVTNTGGKALYINSVVVGGDNQQEFVVSHDTCTGASIAAQKSCVIDVVFTPAATDRRRATVTLTDNALDTPQNVQLSGDGINSVSVPPSGASRRR